MVLGLLGLKVGMTQVYNEKGQSCTVTVIEVGPCPVLQVRTQERDGYDAVQLGLVDKPRSKSTLPERGHVANKIETKRRQQLSSAGVEILEKADCEPQRYIREFRLAQPAEVKVGTKLVVAEIFKDVVEVDVIANSKGRGTAGSMKRHNFHGLGAAHGVKKHHRSPGSIGSHASNRGSGRPKKGHKAAGRMGNCRVTVRNLDVIRIDAENNLLLVRGGVPGPNGGLVMIRPTNKKK
jgi:large subunit ribosomal protein L3